MTWSGDRSYVLDVARSLPWAKLVGSAVVVGLGVVIVTSWVAQATGSDGNAPHAFITPNSGQGPSATVPSTQAVGPESSPSPAASMKRSSPSTAPTPARRQAPRSPHRPAATAAPVSSPRATSSNWAGWFLGGGGNTAVSASWVQPTVSCAAGEDSAASFWVGLDGTGSSTVEQTGTIIQCVKGQAVVYAWYEFYPSPATVIQSAVHAGDRLSATVSLSDGTVSLQLSNVTRGWNFSHHVPTGAHGVSAEVIAEAPSRASDGQQFALTNFGQVTFTDVSINGELLTQSARASSLDMVARGVTIASSSDRSGSAFVVSWLGPGGSGSTATGSSGSPSTGPSAPSSSTALPVTPSSGPDVGIQR